MLHLNLKKLGCGLMLKVLQTAQAEVGYHEQGDNFTKFAEELDAIAADMEAVRCQTS